jgi:hypothetical protein
LLEYAIDKHQRDVEEISSNLRALEEQFRMPSEVFYQKCHASNSQVYIIIGIVDDLDVLERLFLLSPVIRSFQVREREERLQEGFIRVGAVLSNSDILGAFEFVLSSPYAVQT